MSLDNLLPIEEKNGLNFFTVFEKKTHQKNPERWTLLSCHLQGEERICLIGPLYFGECLGTVTRVPPGDFSTEGCAESWDDL